MDQPSLASALRSLRAQVEKVGGETTGLLAAGPTWTGPAALTIGAGGFASVSSYATRPAIKFRRSGGTAPAAVTVSPLGVISVSQSVPPGTYTVVVDAE
jgi:hypothetical protein